VRCSRIVAKKGAKRPKMQQIQKTTKRAILGRQRDLA
jgi:hypothetical protein